ncbi:MAG: response regulator transcription factor [Sphingobacteriales bacterium]|nr:MAG: response regulator transcription factor [Sphingobacteriales bacterium]
MSCKVLYIEDELHLANIVQETMQGKGYEVIHQPEGLKVMETLATFKADICVLDVMLPYLDGFSLAEIIRTQYPDLPIIFLTAKSQTKDVLDGFSSGGTDYLKKPFSMEELMARIDNQVQLYKRRPASHTAIRQTQFVFGSFVYHPDRLELRNGEQTIKLSNREAEIMNIFSAHQNVALDRRELMRIVWGDDSYFISRNLDVYIKRLRSYFTTGSGVEIITLKGKGYHFSVSKIADL